MEYYREYIEVTDPDDAGEPYIVEVRLCHDFPEIAPNGGNQVVVFDTRVPMSADWRSEDMPTDTWAALVLS